MVDDVAWLGGGGVALEKSGDSCSLLEGGLLLLPFFVP